MVDPKRVKSASELDYSAIPAQKRWTNIRYITVGLGVSALVSLFITMIGSGIYSVESSSVFVSFFTLFVALNTLMLAPLMLATFVSGIVMLFTTNSYISKHIPAFAAANSFVTQTDFYNINKDGAIFGYGDTPTESNIITGNYRGFDFELFQHKYWTGSGKNRTQHGLSILNIKLPKKVPHLVIDSKIEDASGFSGSVLPILFDKEQKLVLEGDFSRYFDVYSPRNYQVSALALLTPDVMHTFLTKLHQVDVELVNDRLLIYDPDLMNSKEQVEDMFEAADAVIDEWSAKLKRANIYASKSQEQIHTGTDAQPAKLKRSGWVLATIIGLVFVVIGNLGRIAAEFTDDPIYIAPFMIILPVVLVIIIVNQIIVARRRTAFTKRYGPIKK